MNTQIRVSMRGVSEQAFGSRCADGLYRDFVTHPAATQAILTEHEGRTGEYWPEVVTVRTERSEVRTKTTEGQYSPVRPEQARLVSSLLYGTLFLLIKCTSGCLQLKVFVFFFHL